MGSGLPPQLASIEKEVRDIFKILTIGFQKLDKMKDEGMQRKQLEELTAKMREAKRLIKEFDREMKEEEGNINSESSRLLNEKKQSLIKELNSFVALRKTYTSSVGNRHELLDGGSCAGSARDMDVRVASSMSNQDHIQTARQQMDETVETIEKTDKVVHTTINIGTETVTTSKGQTEQVAKINNDVDTTASSMKNSAHSVKDIARKLITNRCILLLLLLITVGVIVIVIMKLVHPEDKGPDSVPPARRRRLLMTPLDLQ